MRILELILTTSLFLSIILSFIGQDKKLFIKREYIRYFLHGTAAITVILSICMEGYRFIMLPLYLLGLFFCMLDITDKLSRHIYNSKPNQEEQGLTKREPQKSHSILRNFGRITACLFLVISIILAWILPINNLPEPSGANEIGTVRMDFTNPSRTNILTGKTESQKIAVQIWYPASDTQGKKRANWMLNRKAASLFAKGEGLPDIFGQLCLVKTNSYFETPVSKAADQYPVVLFSGGSGMFNGQNAIQMEELASNGFIVVSVSHPKDDFATIYSDGSVLPSDTQLGRALSDEMTQILKDMKNKYSSDEATPEMQHTVITEAKLSNMNARLWAEDLSFIADQIEKMNDGTIDSIFKGIMDTSQFGVFGHSFGGAAAGQVCLTEDRFKAFINIDGTPFGDTVNQTIGKPFMIIEAGANASTKFAASDGYSPEQRDYFVVSVNDAEHMNFTDLNTVLPRLGKGFGFLGSIDTKEQNTITNAYVLAFFNQYLKGSSEELLKNKNSPFSEVMLIER